MVFTINSKVHDSIIPKHTGFSNNTITLTELQSHSTKNTIRAVTHDNRCAVWTFHHRQADALGALLVNENLLNN